MVKYRKSLPSWHFLLFLVFLTGTVACKKDTSLNEVDALIEAHHTVQTHYQARLDSIHNVYQCHQMTDEERFEWCGQFFDMYRSFNLDSQYVYVQKRIELASHLTNSRYMQVAKMNKAEVMMRSGMYHEAVMSLDTIAASPIESDYQPYYFHLRRTLYGLMEDFAITESEKKHYHRLTQDYRDSIIRVEQEDHFVRELVRADALYADGMYDEALLLLDNYESAISIDDNQAGLMAITKAQIYRALDNREEEKRCLIISACSDLKRAIREYIALRELAVLLYYEGDIEHAYRYMSCAIEDADAGNMRGRSFEISTIYPIVEQAHQWQEIIRVRLLYALIGSITLIALLLSVSLVYFAHQRKKLQRSNHIQTMYVGHYMQMSSLLIERFDEWRKKLHQMSKAEDLKHLQAEVASQRFTQEQLNVFYHDFDEAFLTIFPDFVEKVKTLLVEGTEFRIKEGEKLNTDLRVLCCIRLGITDSTQIASFLRYSLSTIYNSRTRMRNMAKGERDLFEQKVATL